MGLYIQKYVCFPHRVLKMPKSKPIPSEVVLDFKTIRNAIYEVENARNPYERKLRYEEACRISHDITEKWKRKEKAND